MITTIGRISYAQIWEPKINEQGNPWYSCCFLVPKTDVQGVEALRAEIERATELGKTKFWGQNVPFFPYSPLRDGDAELASGQRKGEEYRGMWFLNAGSQNRPGVVDQNVQPLMDQEALYSGCWVRLDLNAYPRNRAGNPGVSWGLNNIMLIEQGERLDGRMNAISAFEGFQTAAPGVPAPAAPGVPAPAAPVNYVEDNDIPY